MTVDDCGVFFANFDALCLTELCQGSFFKRHTGFFGNDGTTGKDGDIFEHCFTTVTKTRCFDSCSFEDAADVVDDQRSQSLAFDVFSHDQQWAARLGNLLKYGQQITNVADLLVVNQNIGIIQR